MCQDEAHLEYRQGLDSQPLIAIQKLNSRKTVSYSFHKSLPQSTIKNAYVNKVLNTGVLDLILTSL